MEGRALRWDEVQHVPGPRDKWTTFIEVEVRGVPGLLDGVHKRNPQKSDEFHAIVYSCALLCLLFPYSAWTFGFNRSDTPRFAWFEDDKNVCSETLWHCIV